MRRKNKDACDNIFELFSGFFVSRFEVETKQLKDELSLFSLKNLPRILTSNKNIPELKFLSDILVFSRVGRVGQYYGASCCHNVASATPYTLNRFELQPSHSQHSIKTCTRSLSGVAMRIIELGVNSVKQYSVGEHPSIRENEDSDQLILVQRVLVGTLQLGGTTYSGRIVFVSIKICYLQATLLVFSLCRPSVRPSVIRTQTLTNREVSEILISFFLFSFSCRNHAYPKYYFVFIPFVKVS